jgi:hypothetical protein
MQAKVFALVLLVAVSIAVHAQSNPYKETRVPDGSKWQYQITNTGTIPIVAFHVALQCPPTNGHKGTTYDHGEDALYTYSHDKPILPNTTRAFTFPESVSACPGGVSAVIFADGINMGDTDAIASLYEGREGVYLALTAARKLIDTVAQGAANPNEIANELDAQKQAVSGDLTISVSRRIGEIYIFGGAAHLLRTQDDLFVPSDLTPQHQPRIEDLMQNAGMTHQQAHATIISRKFGEWIAALEGNTQPR